MPAKAKKEVKKDVEEKEVETVEVEKKVKTKAKSKAKAKKVKEVKEDDGEPKEKKERKRREVTRESVDTDFEDLEEKLASEIETLRDSKEKVKGIKFLRSINKVIKTLHKDYTRVLKLKKKRNSANPTTSGFNKPVTIRQGLADFTGWDVNQKYSRIDVTRFLCNYIKEKDLQNPKDRRQILPDEKLCKVLNFDPKTAKDPLTYFRLQVYIQNSFVKDPVVEKPKVEKTSEKVEKEEKKTKTAKKPKT
jgi:chromatin remodeling complex protein RSC6